MTTGHKILVCYNEPAVYYDNYIGKNYSNNGENVDLSETEFAKQLDTIQISLNKYFSNIQLFHWVSKNKHHPYGVKSKPGPLGQDSLLGRRRSFQITINLELLANNY